MRRDDSGFDPLPMPADRYAALLAARRADPRPDPLQPVPSREPASETSALAADLLEATARRLLESGELLLISEEATLADLESAASGIPLAVGLPADPLATPEAPAAAVPLASPRLLSPRPWSIFGWRPGLAEHLRLLEGLLRGGAELPQTMLVGHLETFPERVEHLVRLRGLTASAGPDGGSVVLAVQQALPADLDGVAAAIDPSRRDELSAMVEQARPRQADADRRHALAVARLVLGKAAVLAD